MHLNDKSFFRLTLVVSILIPVVVAVLLYLPENLRPNFSSTLFENNTLPKINAGLNTAVSLLLVFAFAAIKSGKKSIHQYLMLGAFSLSVLFLVSYVAHHLSASETKFGDLNGDKLVDASEKAAAGIMRSIYFFILITHIILAAVIVPLVLFTLYRAALGQFEKHKKIARITFPIWLYVSITGVLVYLMISPYYS